MLSPLTTYLPIGLQIIPQVGERREEFEYMFGLGWNSDWGGVAWGDFCDSQDLPTCRRGLIKPHNNPCLGPIYLLMLGSGSISADSDWRPTVLAFASTPCPSKPPSVNSLCLSNSCVEEIVLQVYKQRLGVFFCCLHFKWLGWAHPCKQPLS